MPKKSIPQFKNEDEEREFWAAHDVTEYFDEVENVEFPNLKLSTETISLRLPQSLLDRIRQEAKKRDMPYQSLMKSKLYDVFFNPNKIMRSRKGFQEEMREFGL